MNWILLLVLILIPIAFGINGLRIMKLKNRKRSYIGEIVIDISAILLFLIFSPSLFKRLDFNSIGRGISLGSNLFLIPVAFCIPLLLCILKQGQYKQITYENTLPVFGIPERYFPSDYKTLITFSTSIFTGAVFEELISRLFYFHSLSETLSLHGDKLNIIASGLFSIGHLYQGWKGVIASFLVGLMLGKYLQFTGTIIYPIALHVCLNLSIVVIAYRRIKYLSEK
jgi:membrane protease YdiL (CAAX protease family)